jgi:hypothetical protein
MRRMLVGRGLLAPDDPRPDARATVDAAACAPVIAQAFRMAGERRMRAVLRITKARFEALVGGGVLAPAVPYEVAKYCWDPRDGERFPDAVFGPAEEAEEGEPGWVNPNTGAQRLRIGIADVIAAMRAGRMRVRAAARARSYVALRFRDDVLNDLPRPTALEAPIVGTCAARVGLSVPGGGLGAMIADGLVPATTMWNP